MITNTFTYIEWMPTQWEYDNVIKPQQDAEALLEMEQELQELYYMDEEEINNMLNEMYEDYTDEDAREEFEYNTIHPMDKIV